jgi:hypothetical protein
MQNWLNLIRILFRNHSFRQIGQKKSPKREESRGSAAPILQALGFSCNNGSQRIAAAHRANRKGWPSQTTSLSTHFH